MTSVMITLVNVGILGCNLLVLWITIKLYTEVLKSSLIKNIGK